VTQYDTVPDPEDDGVDVKAILLLCLLLRAWSVDFWEAWTYIGVFGASVAAITWYLQKTGSGALSARHPPEASRRGAIPVPETSGIQGVSIQNQISPHSLHLVMRRDPIDIDGLEPPVRDEDGASERDRGACPR
jgi:hypothetical protein